MNKKQLNQEILRVVAETQKMSEDLRVLADQLERLSDSVYNRLYEADLSERE